MANDTALDEPKPSSGKLGTIVIFVVMTLFAMGAGYAVNGVIDNMRAKVMMPDHGGEAQSDGHGDKASGHGAASDEDGHGAASAHSGALETVELPPIITNLAAPSETWLRLELAVRFVGQPDTETVEMIHQDLLAFARTMRLEQIQGPSGFLHFKADLAERASIRSGGAAKAVLVKVMLFE